MFDDAFWAALRNAHAGELRARDAHQETPEAVSVAKLEERWPAIEEAAYSASRQYESLVRRLGDELRFDPAAAPVGLLDVLNRQAYEPFHTLVLARLLSPNSRNTLAAGLLTAVLETSGAILSADDVTDIAAGRVSVSAEKDIGRRLDVLVEIGDTAKTLVIIENKIWDSDRDDQLDDYYDWGAAHQARARHFIFLTPAGAPPERAVRSKTSWVPLSYEAVAIAFRRVLARAERGPWRDLLSLYLGTVMQHVVGLSLPATDLRVKAHLVPYLEAALDDSSERCPTK